MVDWAQFFLNNKTVILFYLIIFLLIFFNRKKFEIQAKFIALYRTKLGLKLMDKLAKFKRFFTVYGYLGTFVGFIGMIFVSVFIVYQLYKLIAAPQPGMGIALLIPGVKIPGSPIFVPLWYGIISIFIIATVHEFAHGILARLHNLKVKASGIVFFGPIIGAFVEPDEEKLLKKSGQVQCSVFSAGPFANIILAFLVGIILLFGVPVFYNYYLEPEGFLINSVQEGYPAEAAGLQPGLLITEINGQEILTREKFTEIMQDVKPDQTILLLANQTIYNLTTTESPTVLGQGYIGVTMLNSYRIKEHIANGFTEILYKTVVWIIGLLKWVGWLSLAIGLINLLPLGPVDGGRMFQVAAQKITGKEIGHNLWKWTGFFFLGILVLTLILSYAINLIR